MSNTDLEVKKSQGLFRVESNRNWQRITCYTQLGGMLFCVLFVCLCDLLSCLIVQQILSICYFSKIIGYTLFEMTKNG